MISYSCLPSNTDFCICCEGTTAQKELYPSKESEVLTGHWHTRSSGALIYAYCISFDVQPIEDEAHANFVLLTGSALEDDVAKLEIDLCLTRGRKVVVKLSPLGTTTVSADQVCVTQLHFVSIEECVVVPSICSLLQLLNFCLHSFYLYGQKPFFVILT